jgi:hypothetical protein
MISSVDDGSAPGDMPAMGNMPVAAAPMASVGDVMFPGPMGFCRGPVLGGMVALGSFVAGLVRGFVGLMVGFWGRMVRGVALSGGGRRGEGYGQQQCESDGSHW